MSNVKLKRIISRQMRIAHMIWFSEGYAQNLRASALRGCFNLNSDDHKLIQKHYVETKRFADKLRMRLGK